MLSSDKALQDGTAPEPKVPREDQPDQAVGRELPHGEEDTEAEQERPDWKEFESDQEGDLLSL